MKPHRRLPQKSGKNASKKPERFAAAEYEAMKDRVQEMKGGTTGGERGFGEDCGDEGTNRIMGKRVHAIIM